MNKFLSSFILTSVAGFSTILGYFIIYFKGNKEKIVAFSLAFSSAVMLTISIIDLIPSSFSYLQYDLIFKILVMIFFFMLGLIISKIISSKVRYDNDSLKKIGIISMIAIILHNIPEGIITFMVSGVNIKLGIKLAIAITFHNIPEGISIAVPYYYATNNKIKTFLLVFLSGFSEILGAILCYLFLQNLINNLFIGLCFSLIAGIMINISINELLKEAIRQNKKMIATIGFILGFLVMIFSQLFH